MAKTLRERESAHFLLLSIRWANLSARARRVGNLLARTDSSRCVIDDGRRKEALIKSVELVLTANREETSGTRLLRICTCVEGANRSQKERNTYRCVRACACMPDSSNSSYNIERNIPAPVIKSDLELTAKPARRIS